MNYLKTKFSDIKQIANGRYGKIYSAYNKEGDIRIIKMIDLIKLPKDDKILVEKEVGINKELNNPYIVKFYDSLITFGYQYIILEYCDGGDLKSMIHTKIDYKTSFSQSNVRDISFQILTALEHIHSFRIIHRDVKPENVILSINNNNLICKLADFGLSWKLTSETEYCTSFTGTPLYMAPEVIENSKYDCKVDIWSVGVLIYELIYLKNPFDGEEMDDVLKNVLYKPIPSITYSDEYIRQLVIKMLNRNKDKRPTAAMLLQSKAFESINGNNQTIKPSLNLENSPIQTNKTSKLLKKNPNSYFRGPPKLLNNIKNLKINLLDDKNEKNLLVPESKTYKSMINLNNNRQNNTLNYNKSSTDAKTTLKSDENDVMSLEKETKQLNTTKRNAMTKNLQDTVRDNNIRFLNHPLLYILNKEESKKSVIRPTNSYSQTNKTKARKSAILLGNKQCKSKSRNGVSQTLRKNSLNKIPLRSASRTSNTDLSLNRYKSIRSFLTKQSSGLNYSYKPISSQKLSANFFKKYDMSQLKLLRTSKTVDKKLFTNYSSHNSPIKAKKMSKNDQSTIYKTLSNNKRASKAKNSYL